MQYVSLDKQSRHFWRFSVKRGTVLMLGCMVTISTGAGSPQSAAHPLPGCSGNWLQW